MRELVGWTIVAIGAVAAGLLFVSTGAGGCSGGNVVWPDDDATPDDDVSPDDDDSTGVATVTIVDYAFDPDSVTIPVGGTIVWINDGQNDHEVENGAPGGSGAGSVFDSGVLPPGGSYSYTFTQAGTYVYFCAIFPTRMNNARVVVE
jgi:plastocyanin